MMRKNAVEMPFGKAHNGIYSTLISKSKTTDSIKKKVSKLSIRGSHSRSATLGAGPRTLSLQPKKKNPKRLGTITADGLYVRTFKVENKDDPAYAGMPDWTKKYKGSVSRVQKAAENLVNLMPPEGVLVRSERNSKMGIDAYYCITTRPEPYPEECNSTTVPKNATANSEPFPSSPV